MVFSLSSNCCNQWQAEQTESLSDYRRLLGKKGKKAKRRWKSYSTAGNSGWKKEMEGAGMAAVWNVTPVQGESFQVLTLFFSVGTRQIFAAVPS